MSILKIAVVGHTNTGKTSLMRTLLRDVEFGEVSDRPAVTREVAGSALLIDGRPVAELYDTPGLEDSIGLLDHLESLRQNRRIDGIEVIEQFLAMDNPTFGQEAKALRQVIRSEVALYVIDARDRVHGKHRDELAILAMCARPIVPVLNFIARPEALAAMWREQLSRAGLHAVAEFDTVVLDELGEQRLFEKMRTLLDVHRGSLDALIEDRRKQRQQLIAASASLIAELLIDAATHRLTVPADPQAMREAAEKLKDAIRAREQLCVEQLLELHRFHKDDFTGDLLPLVEGRWGLDLFSPAAMKEFGVKAGGAAAAGAMAGLAVDLAFAGVTLGTATAAGAAIGAIFSTASTHGRRLLDRFRGQTELRCDDAMLLLLEARQIALVDVLLHRGHASQQPVRYGDASERKAQRLPSVLATARTHPKWSTLSGAAVSDAARQAARRELAALIEPKISRNP